MGANQFEFPLNDAFFASIEGSQIQKANAVMHMELIRTETMNQLHFKLSGTVNSVCDNCLDEFDLPIENEFDLMMKISENEDYNDDEIVYITKNLLEYDLTQHLYESFVLSIPPRKVCGMADKTCNEEVTNKIDNFNEAEESDEPQNNPMWDKLKGTFNNN